MYVYKWVDYSQKYGLAFQLSNNTFGACFNDRTIIYKLKDAADWQYVNYQKSESKTI